jgi:predicted RNase H-related nuclease YkuK (DUF458 family)
MKTEQRMINEGWTLVNGTPIDDLEAYIFNQLATKPGTIVSIGTDASLKSDTRHEKRIKYLTVIVFRTIGIPCINHVILRRDEETKYGKVPTAVKLNGEINRTAELALYFRDNVGFDPEVHIDVNPDDSTGSFEVYKYIKGYFESLGFYVEYKPSGTAFAASAVADYFL